MAGTSWTSPATTNALPRRRHGGEAALEIGGEVADVLQADMEAQGRAARIPPRRRAILRAIEPDGEALVAAPGKAHAEQGQRIEKRIDGALRCRLEDDAEQSRRTGKIAPPQRMARIVLERRMEDAQHFRPVLEPARDLEAGVLMPGETDPHRAQAAQRQVDVVRP